LLALIDRRRLEEATAALEARISAIDRPLHLVPAEAVRASNE
jgi:hypothetical protein